MTRFESQSCVRGFHVYKSIWTPFIGETLSCSRETTNLHDPFAVKVLKTDEIVGHLPKRISSTCSNFIRKGGIITYTVNGERRFSRDLTQGGLEIPCLLTFEVNDESLISKIKKMLDQCQKQEEKSEVPAKRIKLDGKENDRNETNADKEILRTVWLSSKEAHITLYNSDKEAILRGERLNDIHILFAQTLLKQQFPGVQGLSCTLTQDRLRFDIDKDIVQVCHVRNNHWIVVSNILSESKQIDIFDRVYSNIEENTAALVSGMFDQPVELKGYPSLEKQKGSMDCGVYCIAVCASLLHRSSMNFSQSLLRPKLISCFEKFHVSPFPCK